MAVPRNLPLAMVTLAIPVALGACTAIAPAPPNVPPDLKAIGAVVAGAYGRLASPANVFLAVDGVDADTMRSAFSSLGSALPAVFRDPSARASSEAGASILLGRFHDISANGDGAKLSVVASFVEESGSSRGCRTYVLERDTDDWSLVDDANAWPDCPISGQGEDTYHDALERARGDECSRLGSGIGTCGPWLYVVESTGYTGTESYFDPQTGLLVAQEWFTDVDEGAAPSTDGRIGCEPNVTERIPCDR